MAALLQLLMTLPSPLLLQLSATVSPALAAATTATDTAPASSGTLLLQQHMYCARLCLFHGMPGARILSSLILVTLSRQGLTRCKEKDKKNYILYTFFLSGGLKRIVLENSS